MAFVLFFIQLGLNLAWSGLFFGLHRPGLAFVDILALLAAVVATAIVFRTFSEAAFWLMVPYALWVMFASLLNFEIWRLNSGPHENPDHRRDRLCRRPAASEAGGGWARSRLHGAGCFALGSSLKGARIVEADALRPESLLPALQGIEVAYYLIHSMGGGEAGFEERDRRAAQNFASAATQAGVQRIIYLGGLTSQNSPVSLHLQSRQETGAVLREFGPAVTEFRAGIIVGNGSISFEIIRCLTERLPIMICPRWVMTRTQPIAIGDVLDYLVAALDAPGSTGQIVEIGGASIETYRSMMLTYAQIRGLKRWLLRVPVLTPRLSSYWLNLVTPFPCRDHTSLD